MLKQEKKICFPKCTFLSIGISPWCIKMTLLGLIFLVWNKTTNNLIEHPTKIMANDSNICVKCTKRKARYIEEEDEDINHRIEWYPKAWSKFTMKSSSSSSCGHPLYMTVSCALWFNQNALLETSISCLLSDLLWPLPSLPPPVHKPLLTVSLSGMTPACLQQQTWLITMSSQRTVLCVYVGVDE